MQVWLTATRTGTEEVGAGSCSVPNLAVTKYNPATSDITAAHSPTTDGMATELIPPHPARGLVGARGCRCGRSLLVPVHGARVSDSAYILAGSTMVPKSLPYCIAGAKGFERQIQQLGLSVFPRAQVPVVTWPVAGNLQVSRQFGLAATALLIPVPRPACFPSIPQAIVGASTAAAHYLDEHLIFTLMRNPTALCTRPSQCWRWHESDCDQERLAGCGSPR